MNTILHYFHLSFPLENKKIRYTNRNPWITRELKNDIKKRDELYKQKKRSPTPEKNTKTQTYQNRENLREINNNNCLKSNIQCT